MKNKYFLTYCIVLSIALSACEKDDPVRIDSVNKDGDEFYFGERAVMWTSAFGDLDKLSYEWRCSGGKFEGARTQNLYENLWIAPDYPGNYEIEVKATAREKSDSRRVYMRVTNYFFEYFTNSKNPAGWTGGNTTRTFTTINGVDCYKSEAISTSDGYVRLPFTKAPLSPPFSVQVDLGYTQYRKVTNVTAAGNGILFALKFSQPQKDLDKPFIREIRWEICPPATGTNNNWRLRMESYNPTAAISRWSTDNGTNKPVPKPFAGKIVGRNEIFAFGPNQIKTLTMTVDENLNFTAKVDGEEWIDGSTLIKDFLSENGLNPELMVVSELRVTQPRLSAASAVTGETTIYLTDVRINDRNTAIGGDVTNVGFEAL